MPLYYCSERPLDILASPYRPGLDNSMLASSEAGAAAWAECGYSYTETSPLLKGSASVSTYSSAGSSPASSLLEEPDSERQYKGDGKDEDITTWYEEAKTITMWSAPLIVTYLLQRSIHLVSVFAVGRIGPTELGAVSCKCPSLRSPCVGRLW